MGLFSLMQGSDPQEISYDKFLKMVDEKKVEKVTIDFCQNLYYAHR